MNILITGTSGFVGYYVIRAFGDSQNLPQNIQSLEFLKSPQSIIPIPNVCIPLEDEQGIIDVRDAARLKSFLSASGIPAIDAVIHLAAQSFVPESFKNPLETFDINFTGTFNLLSALKETGFKGKILYVSSGDIYGLVNESSLPIKEEYPLKPRNPYAVSKVAVEALCYQWSVTEPDMRFIIVRPFNHIGPNQSESFAVSSFAKQVIENRAWTKKAGNYNRQYRRYEGFFRRKGRSGSL